MAPLGVVFKLNSYTLKKFFEVIISDVVPRDSVMAARVRTQKMCQPSSVPERLQAETARPQGVPLPAVMVA